ncbi:Uncharacterized protein HZ326_29247 [Fusarium oxysporum f. sp. albedinis]|nr:Uncharacterized protein HZ326_29247 [Fusarium oxysporum f. sp. albedinis]
MSYQGFPTHVTITLHSQSQTGSIMGPRVLTVLGKNVITEIIEWTAISYQMNTEACGKPLSVKAETPVGGSILCGVSDIALTRARKELKPLIEPGVRRAEISLCMRQPETASR